MNEWFRVKIRVLVLKNITVIIQNFFRFALSCDLSWRWNFLIALISFSEKVLSSHCVFNDTVLVFCVDIIHYFSWLVSDEVNLGYVFIYLFVGVITYFKILIFLHVYYFHFIFACTQFRIQRFEIIVLFYDFFIFKTWIASLKL